VAGLLDGWFDGRDHAHKRHGRVGDAHIGQGHGTGTIAGHHDGCGALADEPGDAPQCNLVQLAYRAVAVGATGLISEIDDVGSRGKGADRIEDTCSADATVINCNPRGPSIRLRLGLVAGIAPGD
jgi:hypothetical protein